MSSPTPPPMEMPPASLQSVEKDLFGAFVTNDEREVSNAIELWDEIPKFFLNSQQAAKLRGPDGLAAPVKHTFTTRSGVECRITIQPASIEQPDGTYLSCFPGITEELVEEALRRIFAEQTGGVHDPTRIKSWVVFTLRRVQRELKARGRDRKVTDIRRALQIMNRSSIQYEIGGHVAYAGPVLPELHSVSRREFEEDNGAVHTAVLPSIVSESINRLGYRQINYERLMSCDEQLARWIYKRLVNRFTYAAHGTDHNFRYSGLTQSGLLRQSQERRNRAKVIDALEELKERRVIHDYQTSDVIAEGSRRVEDVVYTVFPTSDFVRDQKASNRRHKEGVLIAEQAELELEST